MVADDFLYGNNMQFFNLNATKKLAKWGTVTLKIPNGTYALAGYQDANSNGKMDIFLGISKEAYGFNKVSFVVNGDTTVIFKLDT